MKSKEWYWDSANRAVIECDGEGSVRHFPKSVGYSSYKSLSHYWWSESSYVQVTAKSAREFIRTGKLPTKCKQQHCARKVENVE